MSISRNADFNLSSIGKTSDDSRYINYKALEFAIIYGKKPDLTFLQDEKEAKKRLDELDAIYTRGERPPLAEKFNPRQSGEVGWKVKCKATTIIDTETGDVLEFESVKEAARFLSAVEKDRTVCAYEHILHTKEEYKHYKFEHNKDKRGKVKRVHARNIETGEEISFKSLTSCAMYLENLYQVSVKPSLIRKRIYDQKAYKGIWKFNFVGE